MCFGDFLLLVADLIKLGSLPRSRWDFASRTWWRSWALESRLNPDFWKLPRKGSFLYSNVHALYGSSVAHGEDTVGCGFECQFGINLSLSLRVVYSVSSLWDGENKVLQSCISGTHLRKLKSHSNTEALAGPICWNSIRLKRTASQDAGWIESITKCSIISMCRFCIVGLFQYFCNVKTFLFLFFCFEFELLREQSRWFTFYQQRAEKGLLNHDIIYMAATHARHIPGVTDLVIMAVFLDMSGFFIWHSNIDFIF